MNNTLNITRTERELCHVQKRKSDEVSFCHSLYPVQNCVHSVVQRWELVLGHPRPRSRDRGRWVFLVQTNRGEDLLDL